MSRNDNTISYVLEDFPRTLFPLETNRILIEFGSKALDAAIASSRQQESTFLPQVHAYAAKPNLHLRRTLKLDAMAEFFLYKLTYENRARLRSVGRAGRKIFGYRFDGARMVSPAASYRAFRSDVRKLAKQYKYAVKLDIAQYFNSIYHDDLLDWFRSRVSSDRHVEMLARFFREINGNRSIDCLPHGIYPAKIIGSQFLSFVEETEQISAAKTVRFMDDIYLFDNDKDRLGSDFQTLQRLLGSRGLSVNAGKTQFGTVEELSIEREIDKIKQGLLRRRGDVVLASGADEDYWDDDEDQSVLSEEEVEYLLDLLDDDHLEEEDAELVLAVMREHTEDVIEHVEPMLERFPSLSKNIYHFCRYVTDKSALLDVIKGFLKRASTITEFQLFWLARVCEDVLVDERKVGALMLALYNHTNATVLSRAKILEIPESRFGMEDLREQEIKNGSSWQAWAAATGSRGLRRAKRLGLLKSFRTASKFNRLVADCITGLPDASRG